MQYTSATQYLLISENSVVVLPPLMGSIAQAGFPECLPHARRVVSILTDTASLKSSYYKTSPETHYFCNILVYSAESILFENQVAQFNNTQINFDFPSEIWWRKYLSQVETRLAKLCPRAKYPVLAINLHKKNVCLKGNIDMTLRMWSRSKQRSRYTEGRNLGDQPAPSNYIPESLRRDSPKFN